MSAKVTATKLCKWANEEMKCNVQSSRGFKKQTPEDLLPLCENIEMRNYWEYVVSNLRSAHTVKTIKGNLDLNRRRPSREIQELLEKRDGLRRRLNELKSQVAEQQISIKEAKSKINENEVNLRMASCRTNDNVHRATICEMLSGCVDREALKLKEMVRVIQRWNDEKTSLYRMDIRDEHLETSAIMKVNRLCEVVTRLIFLSVEKQRTNEEQDIIDNLRKEVEGAVRQLLRSYPPSLILKCLIVQCSDKAEEIKSAATCRLVPVAQHQERIKPFNSNESDKIPNDVGFLIMSAKMNAIDTYMETLRLRNANAALESQIQELKGSFKAVFLAIPGSEEFTVCHALNYLDSEQKIAERKATVETLRQNLERLDKVTTEGKGLHLDLLARKKELDKVTAIFTKKHNLAIFLTKRNIDMLMKLDMDIHKVNVESHHFVSTADIKGLSHLKLQDLMMSEKRLVMGTPFDNFLHYNCDRFPNSDWSRVQEFVVLAKIIELPLHNQDFGVMLDYIRRLKIEVAANDLEMRNKSFRREPDNQIKSIIAGLSEMLRFYKDEEARLEPMFAELAERVSRDKIEALTRIKDSMDCALDRNALRC